jgi:hypothetical protein
LRNQAFGSGAVAGFLTAAALAALLFAVSHFAQSKPESAPHDGVSQQLEQTRQALTDARQKATADAGLIAELRKTLAATPQGDRNNDALVLQLREKLNDAEREARKAADALDATNKELAEGRKKAKDTEAALKAALAQKSDAATRETLTKLLAEAEEKAKEDKAALEAMKARLGELETEAKEKASLVEALRKRLKALGAKAETFKFIDQHALAATRNAEQSIESLADYLAAAAIDDKEKTRAIYRWITDRIGYDAASYAEKRMADQSTDEVLKARKAVCAGYSSLFAAISGQMGLKSVTVSGYGKHWDHVAGTPFKDITHAWNAVWFSDRWWLIDCTWGAGRVSDKGFSKNFEEFFFLTPPDKMIWSHFPKDAQWQLLPAPMKLEQFEQWPGVDTALWAFGVSPDAIRAQLKKEPDKGLVQAWPAGGKITMVEGPLAGKLKAGAQYTFKFKTSDFKSMVAWPNDEVDYNFTKSADMFRLTVQVQKGELMVGVRNSKEKQDDTILRYVVE